MVGVFVAFIRVVYGRMIYMSLPMKEETIRLQVLKCFFFFASKYVLCSIGDNSCFA